MKDLVYNPPEIKPVDNFKVRNNGHVRAKVRDLTAAEKAFIKKSYLKINGQIKENACVEIKKHLSNDISIFQVTCFVSNLHKKVAKGTLKVRNRKVYKKTIQSHRKKWATYSSPRYQEYRNKRYMDFFSFYMQNKETIDQILQAAASKYHNTCDPDDMIQDMILNLNKSDFYADYDSSKSALKTYFTHKVRGYASHLAEKVQSKKGKSNKTQRKNCVEQVECNGLNMTESLFELSENPDIEESLYVKELISIIANKLKGRKEIFLQTLRGLKKIEIADILNISNTLVGQEYSEIKNIVKEIYSEDL